MENNYAKSGVSLEAGYESVRLIKKHVESTNIMGVMSKLGQFGAMFDLSAYNYKEPVLISGCDGVGTKIKVCEMTSNFATIGQDLVAMSVNDVLVQGAKPLFFLDYIACEHNNPETIEQIVKGVSDGCKLSNCALVGGETAEMPDVYSKDGFDLAGFVVGACEKQEIIDCSTVAPNQKIIGLPSNGLHSNGYSLVRKLLFKDNEYQTTDFVEQLGCTIGEELLKPTRIYANEVAKVLGKVKIHGMAHITGGGYQENIERALNGNGCDIHINNIPKLPIFNFLADLGNIPEVEMFNYFNMGIGYVFIVDEADEQVLLNELEDAVVIGEVTEKVGVRLCK